MHQVAPVFKAAIELDGRQIELQVSNRL